MPSGRPKGSKNKPTGRRGRPRVTPRKTCIMCPDPSTAEKPINEFYATDSDLFPDGHVPYCKECVQRLSFDEKTQTINIEEFKRVLRAIDKPYIESAMKMAIDQYDESFVGLPVEQGNRKRIIGYYFSKITTLKQYRSVKTWEDGVRFSEQDLANNEGKSYLTLEETYGTSEESSKIIDRRYYDTEGFSDFEVTDEMISIFGGGYKKSEYKAMWEKYKFLSENYTGFTNFHAESLATYVRFKVKEEQATAVGDASSAEKWSRAATTAADKARINPSQLSKSDLQGGLNSFSELLMAIEQEVDIIPILPRFKYRPNDAIDFNIWCLINYLRNLEGKPLCDYADVYKFYDERKREYIDQYGDPYGIFQDDPTEDNREAIKKFITLPSDYNDLGGDDDE